MMTKILAVLLLPVSLFAWGPQSLDGWVLGTNEPEVSFDRLLHDGSSGSSLYVPVGTSPFYYEVLEEGEGSVELWIYDPSNCLSSVGSGYSLYGPRWGLLNASMHHISVGIARHTYLGDCIGYGAWSDISAYTNIWFGDYIRDPQNEVWSAGWYKWAINGKYDEITFTLFEAYEARCDSGVICEPLGMVDHVQTYSATTSNGAWEGVLGGGWKGVSFSGDGTGPEDISIDIVSGTGVFSGINSSSAAQGYQDAGWNDIKRLFR